jgi:hypothetical protein
LQERGVVPLEGSLAPALADSAEGGSAAQARWEEDGALVAYLTAPAAARERHSVSFKVTNPAAQPRPAPKPTIEASGCVEIPPAPLLCAGGGMFGQWPGVLGVAPPSFLLATIQQGSAEPG